MGGNETILQRRIFAFSSELILISKKEPGLHLAGEILFLIVFVLGMISNVLLFCVIQFNRKKLFKHPSTVLIFHLAIVDIVFLLITIIYKYVYVSEFSGEDAEVNEFISTVYGLGSVCGLIDSNYTVCTLAVFNFIGVVYPLKARVWVRRKAAIGSIVVIVVVSSGFTAGTFSFPEKFISNGTHGTSLPGGGVFNYVIDDDYAIYFSFVAMFANFPLVIVVILYCIMIYTLIKREKSPGSKPIKVKLHDSVKHILLILALFFIYIIINGTRDMVIFFFISNNVLINGARVYPNVYRFVIVMYSSCIILHTLMNPLIHALLTENYKQYYLPKCLFKRTGNFRNYRVNK